MFMRLALLTACPTKHAELTHSNHKAWLIRHTTVSRHLCNGGLLLSFDTS